MLGPLGFIVLVLHVNTTMPDQSMRDLRFDRSRLEHAHTLQATG
jgi:hypothetical protein